MSTKIELFTPRDYRFSIGGPEGSLEAMTRGAGGEGLEDWLVIICHPHPQHGGTMDNKVVTTVARAAREVGLDSLRFNYRGVGESAGEYGDFEGECEDFKTVVAWVLKETGKSKLILAGFSFGSAVVAVNADSISQNIHSILIAPSVENYPYPNKFVKPLSIIQGSADEIVDAQAVTAWVNGLDAAYDYYFSSQTSHFFHGKLVELRFKLKSIFSLIVS